MNTREKKKKIIKKNIKLYVHQLHDDIDFWLKIFDYFFFINVIHPCTMFRITFKKLFLEMQ